MRGDETSGEAAGPWVPLSAGELTARRAAQRRRRRRRRAATVVGVVVLAAALLAFAHSSGGGGGHSVGGEARAAAGGRRHDAGGRLRGVRGSSMSAAVRAQVSAEGRDVNHVLARTSYVRLLAHRRRDVALTFDDGPSIYTPAILRILSRMHAKATFFTIGYAARAHPQWVRDEAQAGFEIGDHTETHAYLQQLSPLEQVHEVEDQAEAVRHAGAPSPIVFRPPYGSFNATTLSILHSQRMLMVLWSVDSSDYARPGVPHIVDSALSSGRGSIILMHDGGGDRSETVAALPKIIRGLRRRHFHLVTVAQLIHDDPPPRRQPPPTPLSGLG